MGVPHLITIACHRSGNLRIEKMVRHERKRVVKNFKILTGCMKDLYRGTFCNRLAQRIKRDIR